MSVVWRFVGLSAFEDASFATMYPKLLNLVFIHVCCTEPFIVLSRPSFPWNCVLCLTSLWLAFEFKYFVYLLYVFSNWYRSIQFPFCGMNVIIGYARFQEAVVAYVANVAKFTEICEFKADMLILRVVFQDFEGAYSGW